MKVLRFLIPFLNNLQISVHLAEKNDSKFTMVIFLNLYILGILRAEQTRTNTCSSKTSQPSVSNLSECQTDGIQYHEQGNCSALYCLSEFKTVCSTCSSCKEIFAYQQFTFWICLLQKSYFLQAGKRLSQRLIILGYQRPYLEQVHTLANLNWIRPGIN